MPMWGMDMRKGNSQLITFQPLGSHSTDPGALTRFNFVKLPASFLPESGGNGASERPQHHLPTLREGGASSGVQISQAARGGPELGRRHQGAAEPSARCPPSPGN